LFRHIGHRIVALGKGRGKNTRKKMGFEDLLVRADPYRRPDKEVMPPYPGAIFYFHWLMNGVEAGAVVGFLASLPTKNGTKMQNWSRYSRNGCMLGGGLATLGFLGMLATDDSYNEEKIKNEADEMFLNQDIRRKDIMVSVLGSFGAAAGYSGRKMDAGKGGAVGIFGGCVLFGAQKFLTKFLPKKGE
jgi:hypothetical protein